MSFLIYVQTHTNLWIMFHLIFYAILPNEVLDFDMVNIHIQKNRSRVGSMIIPSVKVTILQRRGFLVRKFFF